MEKVCKKCGLPKDHSEFSKTKRNKDGLQRWCKLCTSEYQAANYKKNPESKKKKVQDRYYADLGASRAKERVRNAGRRIYHNIKSLLWKKSNPDKVNATNHTRRAKLKGGGRYTAAEWKALKEKFHHTCLRCKRKEPQIRLEPDHIIAVACGGSNTIDNIQPLCSQCNRIKGTKREDYRYAHSF